MSASPKILAFAGSAREKSWNKLLIKIAADGARAAGAEVTVADLRDYTMPLFDQDLESASGMPEAAKRFKDLMLASDGLLIAAPEYNSSITPLLKNVIDWCSRGGPGEPPLAAYAGKVVGLVSASPGALGGLRGLVHVRSIFSNINCLVIPEQVAIGKAMEAFNADGTLKDAKQQATVANIGARVANVIAKLKA